MASIGDTPEYQYKWDIVKKVWMECLRSHGRGHGQLGNRYFNNFIQDHPNFNFSFTRMFDGTTRVMLDKDEYEQMKRELEKKSGIPLNDIDRRTDLNQSSDTYVLERMTFSNQRDFERKLGDLKRENERIHYRACAKAAEHTNMMREFLSSHPDIKLIAYNIEVYDRDHTTLLEFGFVTFTMKQGDQPEYFHAIVNDDLHNREGLDNKEKFKFGTSQRMSIQEAAVRLQREIEGADAVVAHAGSHDKQFLEDNEIRIAERTTFDTQILALDLLPKSPFVIYWGLVRVLNEIKISFDEDILHNAGNDAHFTMMAFKALVKKAMPGNRF